MKSLFLTSMGSRNAGGLFTTMSELMPALKDLGLDMELACMQDEYLDEDRKQYRDIDVSTYRASQWPLLKPLIYSKDLINLVDEIKPDIIHQQGIWNYYSHVTRRYVKRHPGCKSIIEPHGMLDEWAVANSNWKKKLVSALYESDNLRSANCIHALCENEYKSIRHYGLKSPIAIIPNGITLIDGYKERVPKDKKTLLYIGRIHPKKGLMELLQALNMLKKENPSFFKNWMVKIAGWDQGGFESVLKTYVADNSLESEVVFCGPLFNDRKLDALRNADAFILPSFSEGLPMTVLESWSFSLPVLMTDFCNIPQGFDAEAALNINPSAESIYNGLSKLNELNTQQLSLMGKHGFKLVEHNYQWSTVAQMTKRLYEYVLYGGVKPEFVLET